MVDVQKDGRSATGGVQHAEANCMYKHFDSLV